MKIPYFVVHSFADKVFSGNPAGVCPLEHWPPDAVMQQIALENNLSETAFFKQDDFSIRLRWFAPTAEVDLCGHATLAAAFVLYECLEYREPSVSFETRSGTLTVVRNGRRFAMDFPALAMRPVPISNELIEGLGVMPISTFESMDHVAVLEDEAQVRSLRPNMDYLRQIPGRGVVVTAPGMTSDYVLRCFGPKIGIAEDPATGSAQSMLAPYWSARLGKNQLSVRQLSSRSAEMLCSVRKDRVEIAGEAALYLSGYISV